MSGYLEVKYSFKTNLGLNPFKSWKRQWCILRPSPTCAGGGSLAVYCSEAGAATGAVDLPAGSVVRRAKSRSRRHAFAVFTAEDPRKPRILLAAHSLQDAQVWMEKIRLLLKGNCSLGTESLLKDTYSVTFVSTDLSIKCGLGGSEGAVSLAPAGLMLSRSHAHGTFLDWEHVNDVLLTTDHNKRKMCLLTVDRSFSNGGGELKLSTPAAGELVTALKDAARDHSASKRSKRLSKSESDLRSSSESETGEVRRSSWYSGPSEISLDDTDLAVAKESKVIPCGQMSSSAGPAPLGQSRSFDDSISDRRSLQSIASGIYEEIPELPIPAPAPNDGDDDSEDVYCKMSPGPLPGWDVPDGRPGPSRPPGPPGPPLEPTYESVADTVYATMRRAPRRGPPPPLPPRLPYGTMKMGESWNSRVCGSSEDNNVTRHNSMGSLPRCYSVSTPGASSSKTLPKTLDRTKQTFSVFRKRLKSDSRLARSPKSETAKDNKHVDTKKKKFDFTPTKDIFKNFRVSRKMKNLKIAPAGELAKGETKSCECLDGSEHVEPGRGSKSVECLEAEGSDDDDISVEFNDDAMAALALPSEVMELILRGREQLERIRARQRSSPPSPEPPPEPRPHHLNQHYMVMTPKANIA